MCSQSCTNLPKQNDDRELHNEIITATDEFMSVNDII